MGGAERWGGGRSRGAHFQGGSGQVGGAGVQEVCAGDPQEVQVHLQVQEQAGHEGAVVAGPTTVPYREAPVRDVWWAVCAVHGCVGSLEGGVLQAIWAHLTCTCY